MLEQCKQMLEYNNRDVAIHPRFNKFITALRTALVEGKGVLDKAVTSHGNSLDAFWLGLMVCH